MPIELAGIKLERIHKISTLEQAAFVYHRVPGLEGNTAQNLGRDSVRLQIEGIFYGPTAREDLETLREVHKKRDPVDFLAEIVGQSYFGQVTVERLEVVQAARDPDQLSYLLTVAEFVPPPPPEVALGLPEADILDEAQSFMEIAELPDLLSIPEFSDPTQPLQSILDGVKSSLTGLDGIATDLISLFGEE